MKMKNKFGYVVAVALGCMLSSACKEEMVPLYADDGDGVYFNYGNKDALNATVNFCRLHSHRSQRNWRFLKA